MPFYEYSCRQCNQEVTIQHGMADNSAQLCPVCGSEQLTRLISQFSVAKSGTDRSRDLSWIDKDVSRRLRKKSGGKLSPGFGQTLDRLDSN